MGSLESEKNKGEDVTMVENEMEEEKPYVLQFLIQRRILNGYPRLLIIEKYTLITVEHLHSLSLEDVNLIISLICHSRHSMFQQV